MGGQKERPMKIGRPPRQPKLIRPGKLLHPKPIHPEILLYPKAKHTRGLAIEKNESVFRPPSFRSSSSPEGAGAFELHPSVLTKPLLMTPPSTPETLHNLPAVKQALDLRKPLETFDDMVSQCGAQFKERLMSPTDDQAFEELQPYVPDRTECGNSQASSEAEERAEASYYNQELISDRYGQLSPSPGAGFDEQESDWDITSGGSDDSNSSPSSSMSSIDSKTPSERGSHYIYQDSREEELAPADSENIWDVSRSKEHLSGTQDTIQKSSTRRAHKTAFEGGTSSDLEDENGLAIKRPKLENEKESKDLLACPFYKQDSTRYQDCLRYQLKRIKDVKQHIYRQHSQPEFYCARCYETFEKQDERDAHARSADCGIRNSPRFTGVSAQQKKLLNNQYNSRGKSVDRQWYDMWDIVFPGEKHPESVYVGNYIEEVMNLLRCIWRNDGSDIVSSVVGDGHVGGLDRDALNNTIVVLLNKLAKSSTPSTELSLSTTAMTDSFGAQTGPKSGSNRGYNPGYSHAQGSESTSHDGGDFGSLHSGGVHSRAASLAGQHDRTVASMFEFQEYPTYPTGAGQLYPYLQSFPSPNSDSWVPDFEI